MLDNSQIIALLQKRDEQALRIIKEQYGAYCYQIAFRIISNREDAEECVSDMLINVWNTIPPNHPENLQAYLASLVRRSAIRKYESQSCQKRGGKQFSSALDELAEIIPSSECVDQQIEQRELIAAVRSWIQTIPTESKRIFMQRYFMSESVQAIAKENDMSISAVKMSLLRTRNALKEYLRNEGLL